MAGGLGSRYKGLKQIEPISNQNETILEFALYDALEVGFTKFVLIINELIPKTYLDRLHEIAKLKQVEIHFIIQKKQAFVPQNHAEKAASREKPWGTAHAILCAKNHIQEPFIVLNADDYYGKNAFHVASELMKNNEITAQKMAMIAYLIRATLSENGSVSRGICTLNSQNYLEQLIERTHIIKKENTIFYIEDNLQHPIDASALVSMNFWCFSEAIFDELQLQFDLFLSKNPDAKEEFFIPSVVQNCISEHKMKLIVAQTTAKWYGITYPEDKNNFVTLIEQEKTKGTYPEKLWN